MVQEEGQEKTCRSIGCEDLTPPSEPNLEKVEGLLPSGAKPDRKKAIGTRRGGKRPRPGGKAPGTDAKARPRIVIVWKIGAAPGKTRKGGHGQGNPTSPGKKKRGLGLCRGSEEKRTLT